MVAISEIRPTPIHKIPDLPQMEYVDTNKKGSKRVTLANKLGAALDTTEKKAVYALQNLDISEINPDNPYNPLSLNEKAFLFFAFLWHENQSLKPIKKFEDVREDFVDRMFDSFDDRISAAYDKFYDLYEKSTEKSRQQGFVNSLSDGLPLGEAVEEYVISQDNPLLIALKSKVDENGQITAESVGITYQEYIEESKKVKKERKSKNVKTELLKLLNKGLSLEESMDDLGIEIDLEENGSNPEERFAQFYEKVAVIEIPQLADYEIARVLVVKETRVKKARKRLRTQGRAVERTARDVKSAHTRKYARLKEIVRERTSQGISSTRIIVETGATYYQIRKQRDNLVGERKLPRKMGRRTAKKILKKALDDYIEEYGPDMKLNLSELYRRLFRGKRIGYTTIHSLYHELFSEQQVPELYVSPKRKPKPQ